ncbi:Ig-like domain-containing protein [Neobacillus mesonae]|uniref:Ig-like domain-containing protein n=1 Tax=Neobacillus mesonae TaxID=1193713 RepID=UPI002573E77A|nr:Ig-like domain-containing protein [Neobacillus mesonae]
MKSILMRTGILVCLLFLGWSFDKASAEMTWPSKCKALYGEVKPNQNPSPQHINCLLTNAALAANIPPEVVKAVAERENGWRQFDGNGKPFISSDGGIGLMQITNQSNYDKKKLQNDIYYNIQAGLEILTSMFKRTDLPKISGVGREVIENWYFPVMAYNGTKPVNSPLYQSNGQRNTNAYQEKVFSLIEKDSFLKDTKLAHFPFKTTDFKYDTKSNKNIEFQKLKYSITAQMHPSAYLFKIGNKVVVTKDKVNLRSQPSSAASLKTLAKNTTLIITGAFKYDQTSTSNRFVWYPVKTEDSKVKGYISSAYISRKLELPVVNSIGDRDKIITGKAPVNTRVQIKSGSKLIGSGVADKNRNFKVTIPVQKAGVKLAVIYKDQLNAISPVKTIIVLDKTAPLVPKVNTVTNKAAVISGKAEANAAVSVKVSTKTYSGKADKNGNYKVAIPVQNTGTKISATAKDKAGNKSKPRTITVVRTAPNIPIVTKVNTKTTVVTGKTEKYATVTVKIGKKNYTAKANVYGNFKVKISKQRAGTKLYVNAKDTKGKISATRTVAVSK